MATRLADTPTLRIGDNLSRDEFIRIWEKLPQIKRAELIGVVYMPSPTYVDHGALNLDIVGWISFYKAMTPGAGSASNATTYILEDCPQPDVNLRIVNGGNSWVEGKYLHGAPELLAEICVTTEAMDLHQKFDLYEEAGVQEYLVVVVKTKEIRWHRLVKGKYKRIASDADGVYRSRVFPGLWLDSKALFKGDMAKVFATLQRGIDSDEHQKFVEMLAARKSK